MSAKDCKRTCRDINERLDKLRVDWSKRPDVASRKLEAAVDSKPWNPTHEASVDLEEMYESHPFSSHPGPLRY